MARLRGPARRQGPRVYLHDGCGPRQADRESPMTDPLDPQQPLTPIGDKLAKLDELPQVQGELVVLATQDDIGVGGSISRPIRKSKTWSLAAAGHWMKRAGWQVAGRLNWKGKGSNGERD